ncbi:MAG: TonB-dependent receptor, partial [Acidobacteriaceae bacterium]|nr:TonB-dependent receptor [Acidobacteriaceae bacterium]
QVNIDQTGSITLSNFGFAGPSVFNQWTYSYKDVATKIIRTHAIRFGGELTRLYYLNEQTYAARPNYNFYNLWAFLNDAPHSEGGQFNPLTGTPTANRQDNRQNIWGFFVQDDWKVRPDLTLNIGLRYSYFGPLSAKQNNLNIVRFGAGAAQFTDLRIQRGGSFWNAQRWNFGPQFGFAWSPAPFKNRVVVRGGYGLNYNQAEIAITSNVYSNPGAAISPFYSSGSPADINPNIVYQVPTDVHTLFGFPPNPNTISPFNSNNLPTTAGAIRVFSFPQNMPTAYVHHYSLDTQVDMGYHFVGTIGYQGSSAHHLLGQENLYVPGLFQGLAFNPLISYVNHYSNISASNYNAMLISVRRSWANNLSVNADFTWSKSMDDGSGPYEMDPYPWNPVLARGRSDFNFGKAFKLYGLWQPVFFHSNNWMEKVVGGWSLSGIWNVHGGFPWTPQFNSSDFYYSGSGYGTVRPAAYKGGAGRNTSNRAFQSAANSNFPLGGLAYFTPPPTGPGGDNSGIFPTPGIARNSFTGPGYRDLDASLAKAFGVPRLPVLGEHTNLEIRADFFNLFNQTNLMGGSSISNNIESSNIGVSSGALAARVINLQARFSF